MVTPRQADDVAAARALLDEHKTPPADPGPFDEAAAVARAMHALEEIENTGDRWPAEEKG